MDQADICPDGIAPAMHLRAGLVAPGDGHLAAELPRQEERLGVEAPVVRSSASRTSVRAPASCLSVTPTRVILDHLHHCAARATMTATLPNAPTAPSEDVARSLRVARREAALTAAMTGLTDPFMTPYALVLGATRFQVGLLSSARHLVLAVIQLWSADAVARLGSRKRVVLWTAGLQAALWVPLALVGPLAGAHAVAALIILYTLGAASAALGGPAWGSLMAEYLRADERGRYFGYRAQIVGLWMTIAGLVAGGILELTSDRPVIGFALLCLAAAVSRFASLRCLAAFHEEPWTEAPHLRFSFWQFVRQVRRSNVARFSICLGAFNFATHLAAPFFAVYMLQELHFGYLLYTSVLLAASITGFLTSPSWGRLGDRLGNHAVLRWTILGVSVLPLLWTLSGHPGWVALLNMAGALLWGGLNLAATNFLYDAVSPAKRHTCLAYFNVVNGTSIAAGSFAGGWAMDALPAIGGNVFVTLFVLSTALRVVAAVAFRRLVREVRPVPQAALREVVLDLMGQRPRVSSLTWAAARRALRAFRVPRRLRITDARRGEAEEDVRRVLRAE